MQISAKQNTNINSKAMYITHKDTRVGKGETSFAPRTRLELSIIERKVSSNWNRETKKHVKTATNCKYISVNIKTNKNRIKTS